MDFMLASPKEIAIVGKDAADIQPLLQEAWRKYRPNKVVAPGLINDLEAGASGSIPLLQNRPLLDGRATAYVCQHYTCRQPVTTTAELQSQLESV
jgi:uncharacterized protein YyaL (SSP411 family)